MLFIHYSNHIDNKYIYDFAETKFVVNLYSSLKYLKVGLLIPLSLDIFKRLRSLLVMC